MIDLFFVIDDSIPEYPTYKLVVGKDMATEYAKSNWKVFEVGTTGELVNKLETEKDITLLDITSFSYQWTSFNEE